MMYLWAVLLTVVNAAWLLLVVIGLPGNWLMVLGTLAVAWWQWDAVAGRPIIDVPVLVTIVVLALLGEISEFLAGVAGSKAAGGTRRGAVGALVGALVGGIVGTFVIPVPVLGSLAGTCFGAAVGAWGLELSGGHSLRAAVCSGAGAGVGRFFGTLAKLVAGVAIWVVSAIAAFWP